MAEESILGGAKSFEQFDDRFPQRSSRLRCVLRKDLRLVKEKQLFDDRFDLRYGKERGEKNKTRKGGEQDDV